MQKICNKSDEEGGYDQQKHGQSRYIGALVILLHLSTYYVPLPGGGGGGYTPSVRPVRPIFSSTKAIETCNLVETALEKSN